MARDIGVCGTGEIDRQDWPFDPRDDLSGVMLPGWAQVAFFRIAVFPNTFDVGSIVTTVERSGSVYNTLPYSVTFQEVQPEIEGVRWEGIERGDLLLPFEFRAVTLVIEPIGPPNINENQLFTFDTEDTASVLVRALAVTLFPLVPDWSGGIRERLSYLTQVMRSRTGNEQRVQLRRYPRRRIEYRAVARNARESSVMDGLLWGRQGSFLGVPQWFDSARLSAPASSGDTTLQVESAEWRQFYPDGVGVVFRGPDDYEAFGVEEVQEDAIITSDGLEFSWPAGTPVYPVRTCYFPDSQGVRQITSAIETIDVEFEADELPWPEPVDSTDGEYRGRPLLMREPNRAQAVSAEYNRDLIELDNRTGQISRVDRAGRPFLVRTHEHVFSSKRDVWWFKAFVESLKGRLKSLWVPTWQRDMALLSSVPTNSATIHVTGPGYSGLFDFQDGRRDLVIIHCDGTRWLRRIESASQRADGTNDLVLDSDLSGTRVIAPEDVWKIMFLEHVRLSGDTVEFHWRTNEVATVEVSFRTVIEEEGAE